MAFSESGKGGAGAGAGKAAQEAIDKAAGKDAAGRKDAGQEGNPDPKELMKSLPRLKGLRDAKIEAATAYNKAKKASAKKAGMMADVVDVLVKAYSGEAEDMALASRRAEQLTLGFEELEKAKKK